MSYKITNKHLYNNKRIMIDSIQIKKDSMESCKYSKWSIFGSKKKAYEDGVDATLEIVSKQKISKADIQKISKIIAIWQQKMFDQDEEAMSKTMIDYIYDHYND